MHKSHFVEAKIEKNAFPTTIIFSKHCLLQNCIDLEANVMPSWFLVHCKSGEKTDSVHVFFVYLSMFDMSHFLSVRSLEWKPLPLLLERNNTALVTVVIFVTANDSITISF